MDELAQGLDGWMGQVIICIFFHTEFMVQELLA
jgi:hypothetical protein